MGDVVDRPWEVPDRTGWVLGDIVRLRDGWYKVAVFHHPSNTGRWIFAPTEERLRNRAKIEVDIVYSEQANKLRSILIQDEASGHLVRKIS